MTATRPPARWFGYVRFWFVVTFCFYTPYFVCYTPALICFTASGNMFTMPVLMLLARGLVIPSLIGLVSVILTAFFETEQPAPVATKFTVVFDGTPLTGHKLQAINSYIDLAFAEGESAAEIISRLRAADWPVESITVIT